MELKYIWDTNAVVHYLQKRYPLAGEEFINKTALNHQPVISIITEIELLCWKTGAESDLAILNDFISNSVIYELDQSIKVTFGTLTLDNISSKRHHSAAQLPLGCYFLS